MRVIKLDSPFEILKAKEEVENKLIETKVIESPMELTEFINYLGLQNSIYIKNDTVIPFRIINDMMFTTSSKEEVQQVIDALNLFDGNFDKLTTVSTLEVYQGKLEKVDFYFIINSEYKILSK
jgi:hypothetical protein